MESAVALYAFGGLCVALYAFDRFGNPPIWRTTTTSTLYWAASIGYVAAAVGAFYLLAKLIETNPKALEAFLFYETPVGAAPGAPGESPTLPSGLPAPLIAALFLTILLPRIPYLSKIDAFIQKAFREFGAIPRKSRELARLLRRAEYEAPERTIPGVARAVREQGLSFETLSAAPRGTLEARWLKTVALFALIEEAAESDEEGGAEAEAPPPDKPSYRSAFTRHREEQYGEIRAGYIRLSEIAPLVLCAPQRADGEAEAPHAVAGLEQGFDRDLRNLLREMSHLISCGVLSSQLSAAGVYRELDRWGFRSIARQKGLISANEFAGIVVTLFVYLLVAFRLTRPEQPDMWQSCATALTIALSMTAAGVWAVGLKTRFPDFAARSSADLFGGRRVIAYLASGVLAVLTWLAIVYIRRMLETGEDAVLILGYLANVAPYSLVLFCTAFAVSWMADSSWQRWRVPPLAASLLEGVALAAVVVATGYVALAEIMAANPDALRSRSIPPVFLLMVNGGIGFIIGFLIPSLYRRSRPSLADAQASAQTALGIEPGAPAAETARP